MARNKHQLYSFDTLLDLIYGKESTRKKTRLTSEKANAEKLAAKKVTAERVMQAINKATNMVLTPDNCEQWGFEYQGIAYYEDPIHSDLDKSHIELLFSVLVEHAKHGGLFGQSRVKMAGTIGLYRPKGQKDLLTPQQILDLERLLE